MSKRRALSLAASIVIIMSACTGVQYRHASLDSTLVNMTSAQQIQYLRYESVHHPDDLVLRSRYLQVSRQEVDRLMGLAELAESKGDIDTARGYVQEALSLVPESDIANAGLARLDQDSQIKAMLDHASALKAQHPTEALAILDNVLSQQPGNAEAKKMRDAIETGIAATNAPAKSLPALDKRISVDFLEQPLIGVFQLVSRITGLGFVFDRDVQVNNPTTISAHHTPIKQILQMVLQANQLDSKMMGGNTMLIYPRRTDKESEYNDLQVRTFYLQYADAQQALAAIKQIAKTRDAYVDERTNAIMVRDTPAAIDVVQKLIASIDLPQAEMVIDIDVLEVDSNSLVNLGLNYPSSIGLSAEPRREEIAGDFGLQPQGTLTLRELHNINSRDVLINLGSPNLTLNILENHGKTNLLANPRVRVIDRGKAKVLIGERVPVVTSTLSENFSSQSVNYQDVGLVVSVEARVLGVNEVNIKLNLEASSIIDRLTTNNGLVVYTIGTRSAESQMVVHDNETQALAGLLSRSEVDSRSGLPGLSRIPLLTYLFGTHSGNDTRSEVMLLLTPHIVRMQPIPGRNITSFMSGTETRISQNPPAALSGQSTVTVLPTSGGSSYSPPPTPPAPSQPTQPSVSPPAEPGAAPPVEAEHPPAPQP